MDTAEIKKISEQFQAGQWPQFLEYVELHGLRGWSGQGIEFRFPVVAIVGENGTGKTTLLKAAASAYENTDQRKTYYPSSFFVETHWDRIQGVTLNYRVRRGTDIAQFRISKPSQRWSFPDKRISRPVFYLDISRTLPLDASAGYAKIAKLAATEVSTSEIDADYRERLSHVLGREYKRARFAFSDADKKRDVGLLEREFGEISQFHQGAGEDATLDLFRILQQVPQYSLIIIDEVEASLHPRAQRRIIRFLLWLARHKRAQVIVSTHSPYVLQELPQEARVLLLPGPSGLNVVYGATPEFAMSRIDEGAHPEVFVFVEDREAGILLREIIASDTRGSDVLSRIAIFAVGPANVVQLLGKLGSEGRLPYKSLAFIDGDKGATDGVVALPGNEPPEVLVFAQLKAQQWASLPARFGIGAGTLFAHLEDAMLDPNHHIWTALVGDKVVKSSSSVWEIMASEWVRNCLTAADRERIVRALDDRLAAQR